MSPVLLNVLIGLLVAIVVLLLALCFVIRRYARRVARTARAANKQIIQRLVECRAEVASARRAMAMAPVLRALGALDFGSRPAAQSRLAALSGQSGRDFDAPVYSLDRLVRTIAPHYRLAQSAGDVTLCSVALGDEYRIAVGPCLDSHERFARQHGYRYCVLEGPAEHLSCPPSWMKIPLIAKLLSDGAQNIVFIDADAMVTNFAKDVESYFCRLAEAGACVLLTEDEKGPNAGVMFIRNCSEAKTLMELLWLSGGDVNNIVGEQPFSTFLMDNFPAVRRQVLIEPNPKVFNSVPLEREIFHPTAGGRFWARGDFICHFSGIREPHLRSYIESYSRALSAYEGRPLVPTLKRAPAPREAKERTETPSGGTVTFSQLGELGQFGNQLFQIAATLGYGARHNARVLLPRWRCRLRQRDYGRLFPGVKKYCGAAPKSVLHHESSIAFSEIPYQKNIDLRGYFQCERYFIDIREKISQLFAEPRTISSELDSFCASKQLREFDALHFRCFVHPLFDRGSQDELPDAYYIAAIRELDGDGPLVICTNSAESVTEFLRRHAVRRPIILSSFSDSLLDFYLLSRARRVAISNSSFGWWAAYLGREKARILAPHRHFWFNREARKSPYLDTRDLYPANFQELVL